MYICRFKIEGSEVYVLFNYDRVESLMDLNVRPPPTHTQTLLRPAVNLQALCPSTERLQINQYAITKMYTDQMNS